MPRKQSATLTEAELRIMNALWQKGQGTVQQVLDRASVGRSTFYLHFSGKDDLLFSQLEMFLETMSTALTKRREKSDRVLPVMEMLDLNSLRVRRFEFEPRISYAVIGE